MVQDVVEAYEGKFRGLCHAPSEGDIGPVACVLFAVEIPSASNTQQGHHARRKDRTGR